MNAAQKNKLEIINNYFDNIYVITLERAVERQEKIKEVLSGLNYSFFYGKDKNNFLIDDLIQENIYSKKLAKKFHRYNKHMNAGQIGCSWSHKLVYEDIIQNNYQRVLILEDDVIPNQEVVINFNEIMNQLPDNWDLIYFDYHKNTEQNIGTTIKKFIYQILRLIGNLKWSSKTISNLYAKKYSSNLKTAGYHMYTSAYAVTLNGAKTLLHYQTPIAHIADHLLAHVITNEKLLGFITVPKLFFQESQTTNKLNRISYVEQ